MIRETFSVRHLPRCFLLSSDLSSILLVKIVVYLFLKSDDVNTDRVHHLPFVKPSSSSLLCHTNEGSYSYFALNLSLSINIFQLLSTFTHIPPWQHVYPIFLRPIWFPTSLQPGPSLNFLADPFFADAYSVSAAYSPSISLLYPLLLNLL